jgi:hypothetical protein
VRPFSAVVERDSEAGCSWAMCRGFPGAPSRADSLGELSRNLTDEYRCGYFATLPLRGNAAAFPGTSAFVSLDLKRFLQHNCVTLRVTTVWLN